mgnify:CR=1 FL=1
MSQTIFQFEGKNTTVQCNKTDKMFDICNKFCGKVGKEIGNVYFLFQGAKIDLEKKFQDMIQSENQNQLILLVNDLSNIIKPNAIIDSKQVICPKCEQKSIGFKLKNYHISLYGCDNKHEFLGISAEEYSKTQKVDLAKINCDKCQSQNKSESYKNNFYKCCQCKQLLCPLCKNSHDKSHPIINYDDKCFICEDHGEYYTKYCNKCNKNICTICEQEHKSHKMILFIEELPNKEVIVGSIRELDEKIKKFEEDINNIKNQYDKMIDNLKKNYKILKKIVDEYDENNDKKKNFQIIQNMKNINAFSSSIISDINKVINNSDLMSKMKNLVKMYYKIFPNNDFDIVYKINEKEKEIKVFGDEFVKNNKNNNCKIEYEGEEFELQDKLEIKNFDKNFIQIKLKNTKNITNMKNMFSGCSSLKYLVGISMINTSRVVNMSGMFYKCPLLEFSEKIESISELDISNVTDISGMFGDCTSLVEICNISKWDTSNITNMNGLFGDCSSLKKLPDLSKWNTSKVIYMNGLFFNCSSLEELPDISKWDVSNVTNLSHIFQNCSSLKSLPNLSDWKPNNLNSIEYMFCSCKSLTQIPDISKWNTSKVTSFCMMFCDCSSLNELPDISKWNTSNVTNINSMFKSCKSLKYMPDLAKWDISNIIDSSYYLEGCKPKNKPKLKFKKK